LKIINSRISEEEFAGLLLAINKSKGIVSIYLIS